MFNRKIEIKFVKDNNKTEEAVPMEVTPDYIAIAEEAAIRLGRKLLIGAAVTIVTTVAVSALANIAVIAFDNHTSN